MAPSLNSYIVKRLAEGDAASVAKEKGAALEDAIVAAFALPGVEVIGRDVLNIAGSCEIDIVLYNDKDPAGLRPLPHFVLIESKNRSDPVDCSAVEVFLAKIRKRHLRFGILVAAQGVTGDPDRLTAARDIIRQAFLSEEIMLIVMTRAELEALHSVEDTRRLVIKKVGAFYLDAGWL